MKKADSYDKMNNSRKEKGNCMERKLFFRGKIRLLFFLALILFGLLTGCKSSGEEKDKAEKETKASGTEEEQTSQLLPDAYKASDFVQEDVDCDTIRWMCAAYAIYTEYNHKDLGVIGGVLEEDKEVRAPAVKEALSSGWGIEGREDVEEQLTWLMEEGHREAYKELIKEMHEDGLLELSEEEVLEQAEEEEEKNRYQAAYRAYQRFGNRGIDGWDYCRALQILGDCYVAEYISLEECLDLSLPVAKSLQDTYESWDDVAESYLYGYQFWRKENADHATSETSFRREVFEELKDMEDGPYTVPYDTDLANSWEGAGEKKKAQEQKDKKEGYLPLEDYSGECRIQIKAPEGYTERDFSSETSRIYLKEIEGGADQIQATYHLKKNQEGEEQDIYESAKSSLEYMEENGAENLVIQETAVRQVGEIKVSYLYYSYAFGTLQERGIVSWAALDEETIVLCEIEEDSNYEELMEMQSDWTDLDLMYQCLKW